MNSMIIEGADQTSAINSFLSLLVCQFPNSLSIDELMERIGWYFDADRSYIFERDPSGEYTVNTFEWCREGVSPEIENLQKVPIKAIEPWNCEFRKHGSFFLSCDDEYSRKEPLTYEILEPQGIRCLMAAPISVRGDLIGFLGVDNPAAHTDHLLLLSVMASTIYGEIAHQREHARSRNLVSDQKNQLDNAGALMKMLKAERQKLELNNEIISSISKLYLSIYRIDIISDFYEEIASEADFHRLTGNSGRASQKLHELCAALVSDEFRNEVGRFFRIDTLAERLSHCETIEMEYRLEDGNWHQARFIVKKRNSLGTVTNVLFVIRQTSQTKIRELEYIRMLNDALKSADMANNAKTAFLSHMSHDIRTPMNGILGMAAIAEAHLNSPERIKSCLGKITKAGHHMLGLINDMLDLTKIESGKMDLSAEAFSIADLVENTLSILAPQARSKGQKLELTLDNLTHENVIGDSRRVQQILSNIIGNAIKYTESNGLIRVVFYEKPYTNSKFTDFIFVCEDNGIGMSRETIDRIFEPFSRAEDSRIGSIQGTGLGMVIARNIARMMDGDILVDSTLNEGSRFTVSMRLRLQENECSYEEGLSGINVLLVGNNEADSANAVQIIESLGMNCVHAESVEEAPACAERIHAHGKDLNVCLIDGVAGGTDGLEATRRIRSILGREVPVVILAEGGDASGFWLDACAEEANGFLMKPLFRSRVSSKIKELLGIEKNKFGKENLIAKYAEKDFSAKRILLVEDNELNREIALEILSTTGASVETAENGSIALDMIEASEEYYYDLVLMDIQMPVMDGITAARAIRSLARPDTAAIPIVTMSANAFSEDIIRTKAAGMNDHIAKPIDLKKLLSVLERFLSGNDRNSKKTYSFISPARYYEELYFTDGTDIISEENERACLEVLRLNGAVGIMGILAEPNYPIYCASGFTLEATGYSFKALLSATEGCFINMVHRDDRKAFTDSLEGKGTRHQFRIMKKDGTAAQVSAYSTGTYSYDGKHIIMISLRIL